MKRKDKITTAYVAASHLCWFSKQYKDKTVNEVLDINPQYIKWCIDNLKHLRFADSVKRNVKKRLINIQNNIYNQLTH